jgi:predicted nucleic acid-binding protein
LALIDTEPLVALIDTRDIQHRAAAQACRDEPTPLYTTWPVITEALYFLGAAARSRGVQRWHGQQPLVERLALGSIIAPNFTETLAARSLLLMAEYADVPMALADASLVALAEQLRDLRIIAFDSDFYVYRTADRRALEVLSGAT